MALSHPKTRTHEFTPFKHWEPLLCARVSFYYIPQRARRVIYDRITRTRCEYIFIFIFSHTHTRNINVRSTEDLRIYEAPGGQFQMFSGRIRAPRRSRLISPDMINALTVKRLP